MHDEDILVADRLADGEGGLLVRVVERDGSGDFDAEPRSERILAKLDG